MRAAGRIVLTELSVQRVARNGRTFATAQGVVPAVEPGTTPLELGSVAFGPLAGRLLALEPGAIVAVRGRLQATACGSKTGEQRQGLRPTVGELKVRPAGPGPARLEPPRLRPTELTT